MFVVYMLVMPSGEAYIGSTKNLPRKLTSHKSGTYNENSQEYHKVLFKFIRDNDVGMKLM